jgi:hypothetical protein
VSGTMCYLCLRPLINKLQHVRARRVSIRLLLGCRRLRICCSIQLVNPCNIGAWDQVSVGIDGYLYRAVAHLLFHVCKASARFNQVRCIAMPQRVKFDPPKPCRLDAREEVTMIVPMQSD